MLVSLVAIVIWIVLDKIEGNLCFTGNIVGSHHAKTQKSKDIYAQIPQGYLHFLFP